LSGFWPGEALPLKTDTDHMPGQRGDPSKEMRTANASSSFVTGGKDSTDANRILEELRFKKKFKTSRGLKAGQPILVTKLAGAKHERIIHRGKLCEISEFR